MRCRAILRPSLDSKFFGSGGFVAGGILIAFGIVTIVLATYGHHTVKTELERQKITGTTDMSPAAIQEEAKNAALKNVTIPSSTVANKPIDTGPGRARCFAQYMNIHALEASGGFVYSEMGQYTVKPDAPKSELAPGGGTNNPQYAAVDPKTKQPASNAARSRSSAS